MIEAKLERGRGTVATLLVQKGTLRVGDIFVAGTEWGRVRALLDDRGNTIESAGPAMPVEVLGLQGTPQAGDVFSVVESEARAREVTEFRQHTLRQKTAAAGAPRHARGDVLQDRDRRSARASGRHQSRRPGFGRGDRQQSEEPLDRRGRGQDPAFRRRRHQRSRRDAGPRFGRHDHRLQRARQPAGARAGQARPGRYPLLLDHLQRGR